MKLHIATLAALCAAAWPGLGIADSPWRDNDWAWRSVKLDRGCIMYAYTLGVGFRDDHRRTWEGSGCQGEHVLTGVGTVRVRTKDGKLIASSFGSVRDGVWDGVVEVTAESSDPQRTFKTEYTMGCPVEGAAQGCIPWVLGTRRPASHHEPHLAPGQMKHTNRVTGPRKLESDFTDEEKARRR